MIEKKLIVLFPGGKYSVDMPLLYYAKFKYEIQGYDVMKISYGNFNEEGKSMVACMEDAKKVVLKQVDEIDFTKYEDIVFASKSMGTVIAGWLEDKLNINARHIYLTPIEDTLTYIKRDKNIIIVIAGTKDEHLNSKHLKQHCERENINLEQIEGLGHRLEVMSETEINIDILKQIVALY